MMKFMCIVAMLGTVIDVADRIYKPSGILSEILSHNAYRVISWLALAGWVGALFCMLFMRVEWSKN